MRKVCFCGVQEKQNFNLLFYQSDECKVKCLKVVMEPSNFFRAELIVNMQNPVFVKREKKYFTLD